MRLAVGTENEKPRGSIAYGAFFEYGAGNYSTFNGAERGDGSTRYTGGGLLAKWQLKNGFYAETSARGGNVYDDARAVLRDSFGNSYSYSTDAPYFGAHIGVGTEFAVGKNHFLDVYGKYFMSRRNGVSFDAGGHYDLDAVTSQVLRIGARYTVRQEKWNFYGGLACEHEFDGMATGTADGFAIRAASIGGTSLRAELGATIQPGKTSPWSLDLHFTGFAGRKEGAMGNVSVSFTF